MISPPAGEKLPPRAYHTNWASGLSFVSTVAEAHERIGMCCSTAKCVAMPACVAAERGSWDHSRRCLGSPSRAAESRSCEFLLPRTSSPDTARSVARKSVANPITRNLK